MNPTNQNHIPIPRLREMFNATLGTDTSAIDSLLDISLNSPDSHFRLLHHILIAQYAKVTMHHRDTPIPLVGLDIETNHLTGEPRLLGYSYPDGYYHADQSPTLETLFHNVRGIMENRESGTGIVTWGSLDINCIIRLFDPQKDEQSFISRGFGGRYRNGEWLQKPPVMRQIGDAQFCIDHHISGRSLRLAIVAGGRYRTLWIYNLSQFFPTRIADTAKSLDFEWTDFSKDTHLIDWDRFAKDQEFKTEVLKSNKQDAQTVRMMANHLQSIFHKVFGAYPGLLVSAGSLADAAVSKMLTQEDYESNSWQYLKYSTFGGNTEDVRLSESLISEAYSAGYVDQFTIGYNETAHTADISSAYPHKIRELPDLRFCYLRTGTGDFRPTVKEIENDQHCIFTVVFRGLVTIPEHLEYHPITVKTKQKQNIRPIGTFPASYYLEEREFCESHGATFADEEWSIIALTERKEAPIAGVSKALASMRDEYRAKLDDAKRRFDAGDLSAESEKIYFDSLQNMVKVVDNSLYGKNVMATEVLKEINGKPEVVGLKAGDRYNQLYGGWITALTRVQIARACMELQGKGSQPIMAMTDAVYWTGEKSHLPADMIGYHGKEAGLFEPPETVHDMFTVKTGQYEYRKGNKFYHKVRGLNLPFEDRHDDKSFFRSLIREWLSDKSPYMHPEDVRIPVNTRKLITIGNHDISNLGVVSDGIAEMKPFILSGKQVERFVENYIDTLDGSIRLRPAIAQIDPDSDSPLAFLSGLNEQGGDYVTRHERKRIFYYLIIKITGMSIRNRFKGRMPADKARLSDCSWSELEEWSGIKREWARL